MIGQAGKVKIRRRKKGLRKNMSECLCVKEKEKEKEKEK